MLTTISSLVLLGTGLVCACFGKSNNEQENNSTYEYWMTLDYREQFEYFSNNEYLKDYMKNDYYSCDRHLTATHVQHIADKLNKQFTNKYDRY